MTSEEQEREATLKKKKYLTNCLYVVGFLDLFGIGILIPLLARHASSLGASPTIVGLIGSVYGGLQLLSGPVVGKWSDIRGRRFVLLWCLFLSAVGYAFMAFAFNLIMMVISRIAPGLFKHSLSLVKAYLAEITVKEERPKVFGRFNAISSIGFIIGPVVGGHLADRGFSVVAMCTSSLFFINFALTYLLLEPMTGHMVHSPSVDNVTDNQSSFDVSSYTTSFKKILHSGFDIFVVRVLFGFSIMVFHSNFSLFLEVRYGSTPKMVGFILSYSSFISVAAGLLVGRIVKVYSDLPKLLFHAAILYVLTLGFLIASPSLYVFYAGIASLTFSSSILRVCITDLFIIRCKGEDMGALLGLADSCMSLARMICPLIAGLAFEFSHMGPSVLGTCFGMCGLLFIPLRILNDPSLQLQKEKKEN